MIYINLPIGDAHGWGICGKQITRQMSRVTPVCLLTDLLTPQSVTDELEFHHLQRLLPVSADLSDLAHSPLLQAISDQRLVPIPPGVRGKHTVGYTFFEGNRLGPESLANARRFYDVISTGSTWCSNILRDLGLENVHTVVQGIDPTIFHPAGYPREFLPDSFIVFSGGKMELRKGQDIVIRAFKVLADRHRDALLVTAWYNQWGEIWQSMQGSPHIRFDPQSNDYLTAVNKVLADNGINPTRAINLLPRPNPLFARVYRNCDVGVFPNRCEGGTNLVLMEFMACGMPVIATNSSGHADVVNAGNALLIQSQKIETVYRGSVPIADWPEPDLEQTIEQLEFAYQNRDKLKSLGHQAGIDLAALTWERTARQFLGLLQPREE